MPYVHNLKINFSRDFFNRITKELTDLGYDVDGEQRDVLFKYLNLNKRLVSGKPREVLISNKFRCPLKYKQVIEILIDKIKNGEDISSHLSTRILDLNCHDGLLNDWGIHHLHLGKDTYIKNPRFIDRTGPLLFVRFTDDKAYFINIYNHGSWTKQEMVKIIHYNWPESIESYRLKDVISLEYKITDNDYNLFRKHNISSMVEVCKGVVYAPLGMGYTTSGHSLEVMMASTRCIRNLNYYEKWIKENISMIIKSYSYLGLNKYKNIYFYPYIQDNNVFAFDLYSNISIYLGNLL